MDTDLFFSRLKRAAEFALAAIDRDILCQIKVDSLGLVVYATTGRGESRLSYQKIVSWPSLAFANLDVLALTVEQVIKTLEDKSENLKAQNVDASS